MRLSDFDYELPESAIARYPAARRDGSRLLVVDRARGALHHHVFSELPQLLEPEDLIVVNDTRVLAARLVTRKVATGGKVEVLLVEPAGEDPLVWQALARGAKSLHPRTQLRVQPRTPGDLSATVEDEAPVLEVLELLGDGFVTVRLPVPAEALADRFGALPLPPYIARETEPDDAERYQTIFATGDRRSVAAPTAGLHFTSELREAARAKGIGFETVTLHVGPGTFLPVRTDDPAQHVMHSERFAITEQTAARIVATRERGGRVVAVGTTVTRVLETLGWPPRPEEGSTDLYIRPGFEFSTVDALVTNFHLPRSTLLMLVCAFADRDLILRAYREAVDEGYRFYSYGDAMLIL